jgi:hypothetical protein
MWCGHCDLRGLQGACSPGKGPARAPQPRAGGLGGAPESDLAWAEQALPVYERLDDTLGIAGTLHRIAEALRDLGDFERSADCSAVASRFGAQTDSALVRPRCTPSATSISTRGDMPIAERYYREALAFDRQEGDVRLRV